jgi:O-antigen/teichoic acid export membrane protein
MPDIDLPDTPPPASGAARQLGSQTVYVVLGSLFTLFVGLPLQVYVSRTLGASGLGVYGLLEAGMVMVAGVLNLGVSQTVIRFIPAHLERREYGAIRMLLRTGVLVLLIAAVAGYAVLLLSLPFLGRFWPNLANYRAETMVMGLMIPLTLLLTFLQQALRGFHEIRYMILGSSVVQLVVKVLLTVIAFTIGMRLQGYILASVLAAACGVAWMARGLWLKLRDVPPDAAPATIPPDWRRFALISYASALLGSATGGLDRFLLGVFADSAAVGVFMVATQLQQLPVMFNQMLLMVGAPMFAAAHAKDDVAGRQHLYGLMTDWVVRASLPLMLFLFIFAEAVLRLYGKAFVAEGIWALRILLAAQAINLVCGPTGNIALMSGLERQSFIINLVSTALSTGLLVALVPVLGVLGAAIAAGSVNVFTNIAVMIMVRRKLKLVWGNRRYWRWLGPAAAAAALGGAVLISPLPLGPVTLVATLLGMYLAALVANFAQGLNPDDRDLLHHLASRAGKWIAPG